MLRIRNKDGGLSTVGLLITIFTVLALVLSLVAAAIYIGMKPVVEGGEVQSLTIAAATPATAGEPSQITVRAYDAAGNPVSGANVSLSYTIPGARHSWDLALQLTDQGDGSYTSSLTTQWADNYTITAWVEGTTAQASTNVTVVPGEAADVVVYSTPPKPASPWYTSTLTFYFVDQYGNIVPSKLIDPQVESTFGHVGQTSPLVAHPDDTFSVSVNTADWGTTNVTITDASTGVSGSREIEFAPVYFDLSYDLVEPTVEIVAEESLEFLSSGDRQLLLLDIGVFFPPALGTMGQYDLRVEYDSSSLIIVGVADPVPEDGFTVPEWWSSDNVIYLTASGSTADPGTNIVTIRFQVWEWVKGKAENFIIWVENLWDSLTTPVETPPGTVVADGKVLEKLFIPLKYWVAPGAGVSEDDLRERAEKAENVYNQNAIECRLKYWYVFLVEINNIPENEWSVKAPDNYVTWGDVPSSSAGRLGSQVGWDAWINVYVVPENGLHFRERSGNWENDLGWWVDNGRIFYDPHKDSDNLTLPHELVHELSKSSVKDSPADNAAAQGGRDDNNLMNYDRTGENISENQGQLINDATENNSDERPDGEGGGRIYRPRR